MTQHTQAPWFSHGPEGFHGDVTDTQGNVIAENIKEEDARLIAAAPELLEALEIIIDCIDNPKCTRPIEDYLSELLNARQTITKAKGE